MRTDESRNRPVHRDMKRFLAGAMPTEILHKRFLSTSDCRRRTVADQRDGHFRDNRLLDRAAQRVQPAGEQDGLLDFWF